MDANWRPTQGSDPAAVAAGVDPNAAVPAGGDWRAQLQPEARSRIVNKIMETLKKHLPVSVPEGLNELQKIAVRFEEKIYTAATSQSDYFRKISLKMLSMETKTQQAPGNAQVIPNQNNPRPGCDVAGTTFSGCSGSKRRRVPPAICLSPDREERTSIQRNNTVRICRACTEAAPKEPIFTCPVCLNKLEQPSATTCGHIFCEKCIKASIKAQKKCPTCRKNLGMRSYHRVYLPATADQGY